MDPIICYMLCYFENDSLKPLLEEFGIVPRGIFRQNILIQAVKLLGKDSKVKIDLQRYSKRITEIFNDIKKNINISAQDPHSLRNKILVFYDAGCSKFVLRVRLNPTSNIHLKIPYENIQCLLNPSVLIGNAIGIKNPAKRKSKFLFRLSREQISNILSDVRDIENNRIYQLHIRICLLEPSTKEEIDYMPQDLKIDFNYFPFNMLPFKTVSNEHGLSVIKQHSIDISGSVEIIDSLSTLKLSWIPDYKIYGVAVYYIKLPGEVNSNKMNSCEVNNCRNEIKKISTKTIKEMIEIMESDSDLLTINHCISLNCPLTKVRIKVPVASVNCKHLQCFDAETYILLNEINPKWKCPVCYKPCKLNDLQIQNYLLEILKSPDLPDDANNIEISRDGIWSVQCHTMNKNQVISSVDLDDNSMDLDNDSMDLEVNKTITIIDLTSDSGENIIQNNVQMGDAQAPGQSRQVVNPSNKNENIVIDLTSDF